MKSAQRKSQIINPKSQMPIYNPLGLKVGTPVMYRGLPTQVISGPRDSFGISVVTLAMVGNPVPANSTDLKLMDQYREATTQEQQQYRNMIAEEKRQFNKKN